MITPLGALAALLGSDPEYKPLVGYTSASLLGAEPERGMYMKYVFTDPDEQNRATHPFLGGRDHTRLADAD